MKGDVPFCSFDFSFERASSWPGHWCDEQPIIQTDLVVKIAGHGKIVSTITAMAEGPPHNFINLFVEAKTPTQGILMFSLLEDAKGKSAWGFGKYKIWRFGNYEDFNLFILCER